MSFFIKHEPPEELLNHKEVNYFFMTNFHDVMNNPWWVCRMLEEQKWQQKSKLRSQPKGLFRTIPNTLFDKAFFKIIIWTVLAIKHEKKKSLRVKTIVLRKRLKSKQIVIPRHHFVIKLPLEPFGTKLFAKKIKPDAK